MGLSTSLLLECDTTLEGGEVKILKPRGIIVFRPDEVSSILHQVKRMTVRPKRGFAVRAGALYEAKTDKSSKKYFGVVRIEKVIIKKMKNLSQTDIKDDGYLSHELMKERWEHTYGRWDPERYVRVISFRVVLAS